jgi:hypothetical protein
MFVGSPTATVQGMVYAGKAYVLSGGTATSANGGASPGSRILGQNYPNPFNPGTTIPVRMDRSGSVQITIVTVRGEVVKEMRYEHLGTGDHRIAWDGRGENGAPLPSGVYFCRVRTPNGVESRRMTLLR